MSRFTCYLFGACVAFYVGLTLGGTWTPWPAGTCFGAPRGGYFARCVPVVSEANGRAVVWACAGGGDEDEILGRHETLEDEIESLP